MTADVDSDDPSISDSLERDPRMSRINRDRKRDVKLKQAIHVSMSLLIVCDEDDVHPNPSRHYVDILDHT